MLNKVALMGRLVKDPEIKYTATNVAVASFTIAVDRSFCKQGEQRQADFISCTAWRNTAEFLSKYFVKGQLLALSGSIQTRTWDDPENKKHYVTEVVADEIHFAEGKRDSGGQAAPRATGAAPTRVVTPINNDNDHGFEIIPEDDELPF